MWDQYELRIRELERQVIALKKVSQPWMFSDPLGRQVRTQLQPRRRLFAKITDAQTKNFTDGSTQVWYSWQQVIETYPQWDESSGVLLARSYINAQDGLESGTQNLIELNDKAVAIGDVVEIIESPWDTGIWQTVAPGSPKTKENGFINQTASQWNTVFWVPLDMVTSFGITGDVGGVPGHGYACRLVGIWGTPPVGNLTSISFRLPATAALGAAAGEPGYAILTVFDATNNTVAYTGFLPVPVDTLTPGATVTIPTPNSVSGSFRLELFNAFGASHTYTRVEAMVAMAGGSLLGVNWGYSTQIGSPSGFVNPPFIG